MRPVEKVSVAAAMMLYVGGSGRQVMIMASKFLVGVVWRMTTGGRIRPYGAIQVAVC